VVKTSTFAKPETFGGNANKQTMINISGTHWKIKTELKDLSDKMISFKDNGELLFNKVIDGGYEIHSDSITMKILNHTLEGVIVEDFIFGYVTFENVKSQFECSCHGYDPSNLYMKNHQKVNVGDDDDFFLIHDIYKLIKDYRLEFSDGSRISRSRIKNWIDQFDKELRIPILTELKNIFEKRYCSKKDVKEFLEAIILKLTQDFKFPSPLEFLLNSDFLNLQPVGKSQRVMLSLFNELIQEKYGLSLEGCGTISKKYSIYIDDILCTGLTLISDTKEWSEKEFSIGKTNKQAVADGSTVLVFAYVFIHEKNYYKKKAEMRFKISKEISKNHKMYRMSEIENGIGLSSKIDLIYPLENGQPQSVIDYKNEIIELVDNHTQQYNRTSPEEFYRPEELPTTEQFFTSSQNRLIIENTFLQKGIEILQNANPNNRNIRALGYSIPSLKNFGFGALCFTWRNVPNNAPLVFWYSGGGFTPLFMVTRGGNPIVNFNFAANSTTPNDDLPF
jgi:hypothetical protein